MESPNTQEVMVALGQSVERVVHTRSRHPQVGWVHFEGQKHLVFIGFWGDCPVWKLMQPGDEDEYAYCASRTMPIEDDPDYCGENEEETFFPLILVDPDPADCVVDRAREQRNWSYRRERNEAK